MRELKPDSEQQRQQVAYILVGLQKANQQYEHG